MAKAKTTAKKTAGTSKTAKAAPEVKVEAPVVEDAAPVEAPNVITKKVSKTVTVMFRDPVGITFRVKDNGGIEHRIEINGYAHDLRGLEKGILVPGWGLTHGVDADLWAAVVEKYGKVLPAFTRGYIKAMPDARSAETEAENLKNVKSSLDPVDPEQTHTAGV